MSDLAPLAQHGHSVTRTGRATSAPVEWALCAFLFSIPLEYPDRTIPLEVHTITGAAFLAIAALDAKTCFRRPTFAAWWLFAYVWLYLAHAIFAEHLGEAFKLSLNYLLVALLFWVSTNLMQRERLARMALWSFIAGCALVAALNVLGIATRVVETDQTMRRIVFGQDANLLGGNMALALVAVMALTFGGEATLLRRGLILSTAVAFVLAKSLMLAGSRGAILAVAAGVLAFACDTGNARRFARNMFVAVMVTAALAVVIYRSDSMLRRYQRTLSTGSMSGREQIYPEAWQMIWERPLLGWGPIDNTYELGLRTAGFSIGKHNADGLTDKANKDTHNLVLDILSATGILGGLPLFTCMGVSVWAAWRARSGPRGTIPLALSVVVIVLSMDANWSASKQGWTMLAYAAASGAAARARRSYVAASRRVAALNHTEVQRAV